MGTGGANSMKVEQFIGHNKRTQMAQRYNVQISIYVRQPQAMGPGEALVWPRAMGPKLLCLLLLQQAVIYPDHPLAGRNGRGPLGDSAYGDWPGAPGGVTRGWERGGYHVVVVGCGQVTVSPRSTG